MNFLENSRFSIAWKMYLTALVFFILTRAYLLFDAASANTFGFADYAWIFGSGLLYDSVFYLYALLPVSLYLWLMPQRLWHSRVNDVLVRLFVFATLYGLGFIAVSEALFWNEFSVRFNFISVDYLVYRREVTDNINQSYPLVLLLSLIFAVSLGVYTLLHRSITKSINTQEPWKHRLGIALANIFIAFVAIQLVGQGIRASQESPYIRELGSNGPYQFIAAFRNNELNYRAFYKTLPDHQIAQTLDQEILEKNAKLLQPQADFHIYREVKHTGSGKRYNIMLVMVESLSADFMGIYGNDKKLTPNLDRLATESLLFNKLYATGTRTTRGLEAVTLSIPPTPGRSIVKRIGHESNMSTLGNVLKDKGYDVNFIYGGRGYFDNMNAFFAGNGYQIIDQSSVAEEEIGFHNAWGMADEYLFDQAIKAADQSVVEDKLFFSHIMTTSNHRPYTYPDGRIDIPSGQGRDGAVKYTDWAIGDFVNKAKQHDWFDNTLFVFVADHTAGSAGKVDLPVNKYHIPMLVYAPKLVEPKQIDTVVSQIDIAPTLLGMLNQTYTASFFGKDIKQMDSQDGRALIGNYQHLGYYTPGKLTVLSPREQVHQLNNPEMDEPSNSDSLDQQHLQKAVAFYQGAFTVYSEKYNQWPPSTHIVQQHALLSRK